MDIPHTNGNISHDEKRDIIKGQLLSKINDDINNVLINFLKNKSGGTPEDCVIFLQNLKELKINPTSIREQMESYCILLKIKCLKDVKILKKI